MKIENLSKVRRDKNLSQRDLARLILLVDRYETPTTKHSKLAFSALVTGDGARKVRLERVTVRG